VLKLTIYDLLSGSHSRDTRLPFNSFCANPCQHNPSKQAATLPVPLQLRYPASVQVCARRSPPAGAYPTSLPCSMQKLIAERTTLPPCRSSIASRCLRSLAFPDTYRSHLFYILPAATPLRQAEFKKIFVVKIQNSLFCPRGRLPPDCPAKLAIYPVLTNIASELALTAYKSLLQRHFREMPCPPASFWEKGSR